MKSKSRLIEEHLPHDRLRVLSCLALTAVQEILKLSFLNLVHLPRQYYRQQLSAFHFNYSGNTGMRDACS